MGAGARIVGRHTRGNTIMKKFLMGAVAALAIAAPGIASAQSGYVGALAGTVDSDALPDDADFYGVDGAVFFDAGSLGIEIDAAYVDSDDTDGSYGITGHLFTRNDSHLFGGFLSLADNDVTTTWAGGLEASKYYSRWTLNGALSYVNNDDTDTDGYGVDVGAGIFASDNLRFDANLGWATVDNGVVEDDVFSYGVGVEAGLGSLPISFGVNWTHSEFDDAGVDVDTLTGVLRFNFGTESLFDRDRNGASQANRVGTLGGVL